MFIKNDVIYKRYFNGKIGVISSMEDDKIMVTCDDMIWRFTGKAGKTIVMRLNKTANWSRKTWVVLSSFLAACLAITIHKSQGLTLKKYALMPPLLQQRAGVCALSRCTTLDGIKLLTAIPQKAIRC